jgi:hypothetical protein
MTNPNNPLASLIGSNSPQGVAALNKINGFFDNHPDVKTFVLQDIPSFLNAGAVGAGMAPEGRASLDTSANAGADTIKTGVQNMMPEKAPVSEANPLATEQGKVTPEQQGMDRLSLSEKIAPKATKAQAKLALQQGRLITGSEPGLLSEGTPTKIAASAQQAKSVMTIDRLIPEHATMDEPTLYTAIDEKIGDVATKLKPEMQKVPVNDATIKSINDQNSVLKKSLIDEAPATEEKNVIKRQGQFEAFLKKSGSGTMDDLWETSKAYDRSIPDRVKNANANSPESLQLQKSEWLQRRAILRGAIKDSSNGLGPTAQKAFSDMTDMFSAQDGIASKAEVKPGAPSKVSSFLKTTPGKVVKAGVQAAGMGAGLHLIQ